MLFLLQFIVCCVIELVPGMLFSVCFGTVIYFRMSLIDLCITGFMTGLVSLTLVGVGKMRNCGMRNAESKMRNGPCGMHLIG